MRPSGMSGRDPLDDDGHEQISETAAPPPVAAALIERPQQPHQQK